MLAKRIVNIDVFSEKVLILVGDVLEYQKFIEKTFGICDKDYIDGQATTYGDIKTGEKHRVIFIRSNIKNIESIIAHECYHMTAFICEDRGIPFNGVQETQAYIMGYLFGEVYKFIRKAKK